MMKDRNIEDLNRAERVAVIGKSVSVIAFTNEDHGTPVLEMVGTLESLSFHKDKVTILFRNTNTGNTKIFFNPATHYARITWKDES